MSLLPFQYAELPVSLRDESIYRGAYPELGLRDYREAELWYDSYLETYVNKDLRTLIQIGNLRDFRRFIQLLAARVSQTLELSYYARDIGVSVPTIKRWISILEASYIIFLLPPYYRNLGKRIIKAPKLYFYDTGLVSHLTGIRNQELYDKGPMAGALFENYVVADILKQHRHTVSMAELYYFRTSDQNEIDVIVDHKTTQDYIEIKKTSSFSPRMLFALKRYAPKGAASYLLYQGQNMPYHGDIKIMNYKAYLLEHPLPDLS